MAGMWLLMTVPNTYFDTIAIAPCVGSNEQLLQLRCSSTQQQKTTRQTTSITEQQWQVLVWYC
jgi:hypothetical protein